MNKNAYRHVSSEIREKGINRLKNLFLKVAYQCFASALWKGLMTIESQLCLECLTNAVWNQVLYLKDFVAKIFNLCRPWVYSGIKRVMNGPYNSFVLSLYESWRSTKKKMSSFERKRMMRDQEGNEKSGYSFLSAQKQTF